MSDCLTDTTGHVACRSRYTVIAIDVYYINFF